MSLQKKPVHDMIPNVIEFLSHHPTQRTDAASIQEWRVTCETTWKTAIEVFLSNEERIYGSQVLNTLLDSYENLISLVDMKKHTTTIMWSIEERKKIIQSLLNRPQIEQRTENWYLDALGLLSASQFHTILRNTRTRGQLVLQKAICTPIDQGNRRTVVLTDELTPFTWGIRFEPVVKQIYQDLTKTKVVDLGRLKHLVDPKLAASPDGLVIEGPDQCIGRFVEFKAPVTRPIINKVPEEYMSQMQIQMEVGNVEECDYLEVKFESRYASKVLIEIPGDAKYSGIIYIIGDGEDHVLRYEYSPLSDLNWKPALQQNESILEMIPWWTSKWFLLTVGRSRTWFESVQPAIESFWLDVEKAKKGEYVLQPSSRKRKEISCKILEDPDDKIEESDHIIQ